MCLLEMCFDEGCWCVYCCYGSQVVFGFVGVEDVVFVGYVVEGELFFQIGLGLVVFIGGFDQCQVYCSVWSFVDQEMFFEW